jgi:hypothetical protein
MMAAVSGMRNPILWQEALFQNANTMRWRRWMVWMGGVVLLGVIALAAYSLTSLNGSSRDIAIFTIWITHALVVVRAIAAGANTISREHTALTWDTLVLTGVSARQILVGKFRAVLDRLGAWMLVLGIVRLVFLPILMVSFVIRYSTVMRSNGNLYYAQVTTPEWVPWACVLAVLFTVILTILEVASSAALGMAASAALKRGWTALIAAITIRFIPVALFAVFTRYAVGDGPSWRLLRFPPLSLADSGSAALYQMVLPNTMWTSQAPLTALPGVAMVALMLLLFLSASLVVAYWSIRRSGALPQTGT